MRNQFERKNDAGVYTIERFTDPYMFVELNTSTSTGITHEDSIDIGGGNIEPDTERDFEINLSDFPTEREVRGVYVDFLNGARQNTHATIVTRLMQQTASLDDFDKEFPWFIKEKTAGSWTECGFVRATQFSAPPTTITNNAVVEQLRLYGNKDVQAEVNASAASQDYLFSLGDATNPWRASIDSLFLLQLQFAVRMELV